ncbi:Serine/threonine-protein kinase PknD [Nocardia cerradoensis]|uniref:Serine/threonine-protein kinase PknD n=1 Tax=Nocardia cerradoensis TaxID=85688 RepID=A0A231HGG2_9NOCA|nr:NACHT domain-containing protein [Nocardia cerradoensis]OXR47807.1 Serine/threonine-protein kinase PknD [Nocardia cerradoensis]
MGTTWARRLPVAIALIAVTGLLLWVWLASGWETIGKVAGLITAVIGVLTAVAARWPGQRTTVDPDAALEALAGAVREQWHAEERLRRLADPRPLQLRWGNCGRDGVMDYWEVIRGVEGCDNPIELGGRLDEIVEVFERIPSRRLVVLGEPGSGKSVLAMHFTLTAVRRRSRGDPVPVLMPVASWNPREASLSAWMETRLCVDYPLLGGRVASGATLAHDLIAGGRIWPVLDGLDEAPEQVRSEVITALNRTLTVGDRLLLTSRSAEYEAAVDAAGDVVTAAAVIELIPLGFEEIASYLRLTSAPRRGLNKWDPVLAHLHEHPCDRLASVLTTPLMTSLARAAYSDGRADPGELLDATAFDTREAVETHLLDQAVPAGYAGESSPAGRNGAAVADAERRLRLLAGDLDRCGDRELAWWKRHLAIPSPLFAAVSGVAVGMLVVAVTLAAAWPTHSFTSTRWGESVEWSVRLGSLAAVVIGFFTVADLDRETPTFRRQAGRFTMVMALGSIAALAVGGLTYRAWIDTSYRSDITDSAVDTAQYVAESFLLIALVVGFVRVPPTPSPTAVLRESPRIADTTAGRFRAWIGPIAGTAAVVGIVFGLVHAIGVSAAGVVVRHESVRDVVLDVPREWLTVGPIAGLCSALGVRLGRRILRPVFAAGAERATTGQPRILAAVTVTAAGVVAGAFLLPIVREMLGGGKAVWEPALRAAKDGIRLGIGPVVILAFLPWETRPMSLQLRLRGRLLRLLIVSAIAATVGATTLWFAADLPDAGQKARDCVLVGPPFGLAVGILAVALDRPVTLDRPMGPLASLRLDRRAAVMYSLAYAVAASAATWLHAAINSTAALDAQDIGVFAVAFFVISYFLTASGRHTITSVWLWLAGRMPLRDMEFYRTAHRRGVLRQVGSVYQFRHALLQDRLAAGARRPFRHSRARAALVLAAAAALALSSVAGLVHHAYEHRDRLARSNAAALPFDDVSLPLGVAVDHAGTMYVAGTRFGRSANHVDDTSALGRLWRWEQGAPRPSMLPLTNLGLTFALAVDRANNLYVADRDNRHVLVLGPRSTVPATLPFSELVAPIGLDVSESGDVYVSDNGTGVVWKLPAGSTTAIALPFPKLDHVTAVAIDSAGTVYATEAGRNRVLKLTIGSTVPTALPFGGLDKPTGIAVDSEDTLYVCDRNGQVMQLRAGSAAPEAVHMTGLRWPQSIAVDDAHNLYVTNPYDNRVLELPAPR